MSRIRVRAAVREVLIVALPTAVGYAVAGLTGALVAGAAVIAGRLPSDTPGRAVAMAAAVLLAGAALATVLEVDIGGPVSLAFPQQRQLAADLGAAAGILLLAAVVTSAAAEREPEPAYPAPAGAVRPQGGVGWGWRETAVLLGAFLVRLAAAPAPPDALRPLIARIQAGDSLVVPGKALVAPLAPVAAAFGPGGGRMALVAAGTGVVAAVVVLARVLAPRGVDRSSGALLAGAGAAVLPGVWLLALPETLAALAALGAVLLARPSRLDPRRALAAGVLAGFAALARPDAVVVLPVLVVWVLVAGTGRRPSRRAVHSAWAAALGAVCVLVPWVLWAHGETGTWLPAETFGPQAPGRGAAMVAVVGVSSAVAVAVAALAALRTFRRSLRALLPLVALPLWCASMTLVEGFGHGAPLSWGAPLVAVLAGWQASVWLSRRQPSPQEAGVRSSS